MTETFEQFLSRLDASHTNFDELARWYWDLKQENRQLIIEREALRREITLLECDRGDLI